MRGNRPGEGERGVALVITLILLVVITTLAVAFLALSTRETSSVSGSSATIGAELATDVALERSKAQILAQIAARNSNGLPNDILGPELMVSVAIETSRRASDRMITNPSPPVFIWTNKSINNASAVDDRFWLDLNRNLQFEQTGYLTNLNDAGMPILGAGAGGNPAVASPIIQWRVGDPQWIGLLRDPTRPHGPDNPFIARYAYLILPAGRSLDINWIHNQAIQAQNQFDGYFRNQGLGPWEMNLAAFLADVNPNYWNANITPPGGVFVSPYRYRDFTNYSPGVVRGDGVAFSDARELLCYRFPGLEIGNRRSFGSCRTYFASSALMQTVFPSSDSIDLYCNGPIAPFGSSALTATMADGELPDAPWPGSRSTNHYFTIHDLWKVAGLGQQVANEPSPSGFFTRLKAASARGNSEDRYTYYRILAQLGTDSVPEKDDRLNINYRVLTNDLVTPIAQSPTNYSRSALATNVEPWTATEFFHSAVDRLLTNEFFPYGITNIRLSGIPGGAGIPIYLNNSVHIGANTNNPPLYSPRIHQLLQMTLNIYEAMTNNFDPLSTNLPTVLRPVFEQINGDIYITHYVNETGRDLKSLINPSVGAGTYRWYELGDPAAPVSAKGSTPNPNVNFYDIPILFGARKGIPNFNEFTMNTVAHFTRKVQVEKDLTLTRLVATNQMLIMSISNSFIAEFWNSYSNYANPQLSYPRELEFFVAVSTSSLLTDNNSFRGTSTVAHNYARTNDALTWSNAYRLTDVITNTALIPSIFYAYPPNGPGFKPFDLTTSANNRFERVGTRTNRWSLSVSNRVLCFLFDDGGTGGNLGRLVDCYTSARMNSHIDLSKELDNAATDSSAFQRMWHPQLGIQNQITTSRGPVPNGDEWIDYADLAGFSTIQAATSGFEEFITGDTSTQRVMQAGFSPNIRILSVSSWEANDPLVHYTVYDLFGGQTPVSGIERLIPRFSSTIFTNPLTPVVSSPGYRLGNHRLEPWGSVNPAVGGALELFRFAEKDPGVYSADQWDFPLQRFPSLGWLGRVHRGTPWQTIYLKAPDPNYTMADWALHTGAAYMTTTFPTNDWRLLDVFTAAIHPNATRGRLSINQTNPAAWSAVFASVPITAALNDGSGAPPAFETNVQPRSVDTPLAAIVDSINLTRSSVFNGQFKKLSEFMMVTNLTIGSPYFSNFDPGIKQSVNFYMTDLDYERLPQQILSLVKVGEPRYVVYAWGQSLKPADYVPGIGIGIDAGTKLTRNYQITGEMATRSVVRVEFERDQFTGQSLFNRPHAVVENFNILPNE